MRKYSLSKYCFYLIIGLVYLTFFPRCKSSASLQDSEFESKSKTSIIATYSMDNDIWNTSHFSAAKLEIVGPYGRFTYTSYPAEEAKGELRKIGSIVLQEIVSGDIEGLPIYTDLAKGILLQKPDGSCRQSSCFYLDSIPAQTPAWNLLQEERIIDNKYLCRKATTSWTGREYEAYYIVNIPTSIGPYKFHGLPGLIYSIKSTDGIVDIKLTSVVENKEKLIWIMPDEKQAMSSDMIKKSFFEIFSRVKSEGFSDLIVDPDSNAYIEKFRFQYADEFIAKYGL